MSPKKNAKSENEKKNDVKEKAPHATTVGTVDLSSGTTEGNPDDTGKSGCVPKETSSVTSSEALSESSSTAQFSLILVILCEALAASSAFAAFPALPPTTRWLIYSSFYAGHFVSSVLIGATAARTPATFLRPAVLLSLAGVAAAQALYGFSCALPLWVAARALCGFFAGGGAAYARAALAAAPDAPKLLICASLAYSAGVAVGSVLCVNLQWLLVDGSGLVADAHCFLGFLSEPVGIVTAVLVLLAFVFALFFARGQWLPLSATRDRELEALPKRFLFVGGFVAAFSVIAVVYSGALSAVWFVSEKGLVFDYEDTVALCFQFVLTAVATHVVMSFVCTSKAKVLWTLRAACLVYAVSLCCTPGASSLRGSKLVWVWVATVQTLSCGMSQVVLCCSYIVINMCVARRNLLQTNAFAQAVVAVLHYFLPLCVQKIAELAEMPESYNSATYFLLFAVGAAAVVLSMIWSLFISGEELATSSPENVIEIEMKEVSNGAKADKQKETI